MRGMKVRLEDEYPGWGIGFEWAIGRDEAAGEDLGPVRLRSAGSESDGAVECLGQDLLDPFLIEGTVDLLDVIVEGGQSFVVEAGVEGGADQVECELDMFEEGECTLGCKRVVVEADDELRVTSVRQSLWKLFVNRAFGSS